MSYLLYHGRRLRCKIGGRGMPARAGVAHRVRPAPAVRGEACLNGRAAA